MFIGYRGRKQGVHWGQREETGHTPGTEGGNRAYTGDRGRKQGACRAQRGETERVPGAEGNRACAMYKERKQSVCVHKEEAERVLGESTKGGNRVVMCQVQRKETEHVPGTMGGTEHVLGTKETEHVPGTEGGNRAWARYKRRNHSLCWIQGEETERLSGAEGGNGRVSSTEEGKRACGGCRGKKQCVTRVQVEETEGLRAQNEETE